MSNINSLVLQQLEEGFFDSTKRKMIAPLAMVMALNHGHSLHYDYNQPTSSGNDSTITSPIKKNNLPPPAKVIGDKLQQRRVNKQFQNVKNNLSLSSVG